MWKRYRKIKPAAGLVLAAVALLLMEGKPDSSPKWLAGMILGAGLVLAYVVEELVWIVHHRGRPCPRCGLALSVRPFRLHLRCPRCGVIP